MGRIDGLHFIDSSVFISVIFNDNHSKKAGSYLRRVQNSTYKAYISHMVIGEIGAIPAQFSRPPKFCMNWVFFRVDFIF